MKKKGFTLVELLTVIAILAIILLIAAPTILNVLEKAKQNSFKNQVLLYVEGVRQNAVLSQVGEGNIVLPGNNESVDVDITTITLDIDKKYTGVVKITNDNGKYKYEVVNITGDGYQANGQTNNITVTKTGQQLETPKPTYTVYSIGDQVTLKDNSVWYVIESSDSSSDTVTLFASQNIKNDASGWTTTQSEYKIAFDEANARATEKNSYCTHPEWGCNMYATNGTTVTEDSTIKKFIDGSVTTYINNSLTANGGTYINQARLLTFDEMYNVMNVVCVDDCRTSWKTLIEEYTNVPEWLYSTNYWLMEKPNGYTQSVWKIMTNSNLAYDDAARDSYLGARPVIVTSKSNIK